MTHIKVSDELIKFIEKCPSMFHTVRTISEELNEAGYTYLKEGQSWNIEKGGKYYTTRNGSSLIAFQIGSTRGDYHFQLSAAHSDSPTFKLKTVPETEGQGGYLKLNVEGYGGMIDSSWLDRPLTIAGRVMVQEGDQIESRLVHIDKDLLIIPNVCIHFNRKINDGYTYNRQVDLCPLFSAGELTKGDFDKLIAEACGIENAQDAKKEPMPGGAPAAETTRILGKDLFLVNRQRGVVWGAEAEFVSSPRLDDLQCAFASLKGFLAAENNRAVNVYCVFDNEEVGSNTKQGAMSTFLYDTLQRINIGLGKTAEDYYSAVARSFLVSCDNAHAVHPNHPELSDKDNAPYMNKGIVIKENANQKYTTDAVSRAAFTAICNKAGVPVQTFANRSDIAGGSTLGNLSNTQVSLNAVDIGLPQLAMHSSFETAGSRDTEYAIRALKAFFETDIEIGEGGIRLLTKEVQDGIEIG
ncbi:MAG: M18 family aminopeptidase [Eubacteriales bacterium]|nr:M18 family aminopeptidase [Eubacteriales bacterium]